MPCTEKMFYDVRLKKLRCTVKMFNPHSRIISMALEY